MAKKPTKKKIIISKFEVEKNRELWAKVAKENGWYHEPFYIQIWVNKSGTIIDSVSFYPIKKNFVVHYSTEKELTKKEYIIK